MSKHFNLMGFKFDENKQYIFESKIAQSVLTAEFYAKDSVRVSVYNKNERKDIKSKVVGVDALMMCVNYYSFKLVKELEVSEIEQCVYNKKTLEELK